jgi:hypothetical protein
LEADDVGRLVDRLGPRDRRALMRIVRSVSEVAEEEGQEAALQLLDEIMKIVMKPEALS